MDIKNLRELMEAYSEVYAPEQLDELSVNKMLAYGKAAQKDRDVLNKKWDEKKASHKEKMRVLGHEEGEERAAEKIKKKTGKYPHQMNALDKARYAVTKEELDIFDVVLEFLQVEGFAETLEEAEWMMANVIDGEAIGIILGEEQLDEISQKTATSAYAASKTGEFEGADSDRDIKRSDNLRRHIKRKFGAGAAKHADRAADSMTFGRKDKSGRSKQSPKPRIEKSDYRTTQDGKMHKQDQKELKTNLRIKRDRRLRAKES